MGSVVGIMVGRKEFAMMFSIRPNTRLFGGCHADIVGPLSAYCEGIII